MEDRWVQILSAVSTAAAAGLALFFGTIPLVQRRSTEKTLANLHAARIHPQIKNLLAEVNAVIPGLAFYDDSRVENGFELGAGIAKLNILCVNINNYSLDAIVSLPSNCANNLAHAIGLIQVAAAESAITNANIDWWKLPKEFRLKNVESWRVLILRAATLLESGERVLAQRVKLTVSDNP